MDGKHTPGPWVWWTSNSWRRLRREDRGISQPVVEPFVARDGHPDLTVSDADARLIAAAPELLALLEEVSASSVIIPSMPSETAVSLSIVERVRTAIAKAVGSPDASEGDRT